MTRRFFNLYGPTEATIWATAALCEGDGQALDRIADRQRKRICAGPAVAARSHWCAGRAVHWWGRCRAWLCQRTGSDRHEFILDPFRADADMRLYRTGDLVRWRAEAHSTIQVASTTR